MDKSIDINMSISFVKIEVNNKELLKVFKMFLWGAGLKTEWGGTDVSCFIFISYFKANFW